MGGTLIEATTANPAVPSSGELPGINLEVYSPTDRPTIAEFEQQHPEIPLDEDGLPIVAEDAS